jgi:hypothetical protein
VEGNRHGFFPLGLSLLSTFNSISFNKYPCLFPFVFFLASASYSFIFLLLFLSYTQFFLVYFGLLYLLILFLCHISHNFFFSSFMKFKIAALQHVFHFYRSRNFRNIYKISFQNCNDFYWFVSAIVVGCYVAAVFALLLGGLVWYK